MMAGNPNWWNMYVHQPSYHQQTPPPPLPPPSTLISSSTSSSSTSPYFFHPQFVVGSSSSAEPPHNLLPFSDDSVVVDQEQLPHLWSQLLLGGLPVEEVGHFQMRKLDNWESEEDKNSNGTLGGVGPKQEAVSPNSNNSSNDAYAEDLSLPLIMPTPWAHIMMPVSSPTSCVTNLSGGGNMWDFSKTTKDSGKNRISHHSLECNSTATGGSCKKAKVHLPSSQPPLKVRKERLGDRITALHQLVSPFGKTDTASVLLEAIGYIRFLQGQIEALSSPYLSNTNGSGNVGSHHHSVHGEANYAFFGDAVTQDNHDKPKDLRSRGLCLVPVSCTSQVGNANGDDYWAPTFGGWF